MNKQALEICVKYRGFLKHSDATGLYVSWCSMLDIKSQGTTRTQARASLDDSVSLYEALDHGCGHDRLAGSGRGCEHDRLL